MINNHISRQQHLKDYYPSASTLCCRHLLCFFQGFQSACSPGAGEPYSACPSTDTAQTCPSKSKGAEEQLVLPWDYLTSSAKTGRKMIIVAVLLANSVNKAMTIVTRMTATGGGTLSKGCRRPPIQTDKPDSCRRRSKQAGEQSSYIPARELILSYNNLH